MTEKTLKIPKQTRSMGLLPGSFNRERRTVDVVFAKGSRGLRSSWEEDYEEELSMMPAHVRLDRLNAGASVLDSHQSYSLSSVIGTIVPGSARVNGSEGVATVQFSEREEVAGIVRDIEQGIIRHLSVGYMVHRYEVTRDKGKLPVYRAVDWEPFEVSFVPVPFDAGAQTRAGEDEFNCSIIETRAASALTEGNTMTDEVKKVAAKQADEVEVEQRAAQDLAVAKAKEAGEKAERARHVEIRSIVQSVKLGTEKADDMIARGVSIEDARKEVITMLAEKDEATQTRGAVNIETVEDEKDKWHRGASDWIIQKAAVRAVVEKSGAKVDPGQFRGLSLYDLARESLERAGVKTRGMNKMDVVAKAFMHRNIYQGTSDFTVLLENTMHKILLAAFATTPDTWTSFCAKGSVSDFRAHNRYRLGSFGGLDAINEHGEFQRKAIPDGHKESITASTKGNTIGITRQTIINDDMGAFNSLATQFGRAAKLSVELDVYTSLALNAGLGPLLSDGLPIFDAAHNNLGSSATITVAAIDADAVIMAEQTDYSGNEILDLNPKVLLLARALKGAALNINSAEFDPTRTSNTHSRIPNIVRGMFDEVVATARLTGNRRYLFADPMIAPVLEVAFLDGIMEPFMESREGWTVDGTEWKVRMDYGVAGVGYHGAVTNAGG